MAKGQSGPHQAGDRRRGLVDLVGSAIAAIGNGLRDAMAEMILKQPEGN